MQMRITIRFDYGSVVPWVRSLDGGLQAVAGPDALLLATPIELEGRGFHTFAEFEVGPGDRVPFVLTWSPSHLPPSGPRRRGAGARGHRGLLDRMGQVVRPRRPLPRRARPLARDAESPHVRPDRGNRRRADDVAPREPRRRAELGLPLLLAARRDVDAPGAHPRGLRGRGRRVARLAPAGDRRPPRGDPDHVRDRRRAAADRARARLALRVRGLAARPHRQRRVAPAPARRVRRGRRRPLPRTPGRDRCVA